MLTKTYGGSHKPAYNLKECSSKMSMTEIILMKRLRLLSQSIESRSSSYGLGGWINLERLFCRHLKDVEFSLGKN